MPGHRQAQDGVAQIEDTGVDASLFVADDQGDFGREVGDGGSREFRRRQAFQCPQPIAFGLER